MCDVCLFRLLNGIESNSFNWKNCTMHVQDFRSPGTNVTAEIPEKDANNFKEMCKLFSSTTLHGHYIKSENPLTLHGRIIDEYLMNVTLLRSAILNGSTLDMYSGPM